MKNVWRSIAPLIAVCVGGLLFENVAWADGFKASALRASGRHEQPVSVLQNRFFLKGLRPEVGFTAGTMMNEAYTDTRAVGLRLGLFANEWIGGEVQYLTTFVSDSADRKALNTLEFAKPDDPNTTVTPDPEVNPIREIQDANLIVAPFYGKLNVADWMIVYSDLYFTSGVSRVLTDQGAKTAFSLGAGQRFYLMEAWSLRLDFRNRSFVEQRAGRDSRRNAWGFDIGASYFFL